MLGTLPSLVIQRLSQLLPGPLRTQHECPVLFVEGRHYQQWVRGPESAQSSGSLSQLLQTLEGGERKPLPISAQLSGLGEELGAKRISAKFLVDRHLSCKTTTIIGTLAKGCMGDRDQITLEAAPGGSWAVRGSVKYGPQQTHLLF